MAIWQVSFILQSRTSKKMQLTDERFNQSLEIIKAVFPEEKSWCDSIKQYGSLDSTCIEIDSYYNTYISDISVRIDLRNCTINHLESISSFAAWNDCIVKYNNCLYEAIVDNIILISKDSAAWEFLHDPDSFLQQLKRKKQKR